MKEDSVAPVMEIETCNENSGPCAGGMASNRRKFRRLRSLTDNKILHLPKEQPKIEKVFDPTAWYVADVKRHTELSCASLLNDPKGFLNSKSSQPYQVEAYAAAKTVRTKKTIVIHGKIFIRVDEANRIDVLKQCPSIRGFRKDPTLLPTAHGFTDFARVPDAQIRALQEILQIADGAVEYSEEVIPQVNDSIKLTDGILSKSAVLKDLEGTVEMVNGKNRVTVILDRIGSFKFTLSPSSLSKLTRQS